MSTFLGDVTIESGSLIGDFAPKITGLETKTTGNILMVDSEGNFGKMSLTATTLNDVVSTGVIPYTKGGTGLTSLGQGGDFLRTKIDGTGMEWADPGGFRNWAEDQGSTNIHASNYSNTQLSDEQVNDVVGVMVGSGSSQSGVAVTYNTSTKKLDFAESVADAAEGTKGKVKLATTAEASTGTDTEKAITAAGVKAHIESRKVHELTAPTADLDMNSQKITNLDEPTSDNDAARKVYVDASVGERAPKASPTFTGTPTVPTLMVGGTGNTSNNWISIDALDGDDSSGGGIAFFETASGYPNNPVYGAKIVYNENDDDFNIGTVDGSTFKKQLWMNRGADRVYVKDELRVQAQTPAIQLYSTDTSVATDQQISRIRTANSDDGGSTAEISFVATENHASGANGGTKIEFNTTPNGASTFANAATIGQDKSLTVAGDIITANGGKISTGIPNVYGSTIKLMPSDFASNTDGGNTKFGVGYTDSAGTGYGMRVANNTSELYAFVAIPEGMKATHVNLYDKNDVAFEVFEVHINATTMTSKGSGTCNTELDITDVSSSATNFLAIEYQTTTVDDRLYGGSVTIAAI